MVFTVNDPSTIVGTTVPEHVRWSPSASGETGLRAFTEDGTERAFIPWQQLKAELDHELMPQLLADPVEGWTFALADYHGKKDWLVFVVDQRGERYCDVWFGNDPENGWGWDGFIRVGDSESEPHAWQVYQRYSDGTYRRLPSLSGSIDAFRAIK